MNNNIKWTNVLYQQTIDYLENGNIPPFRKDKLERFIIRSNKINVEDNKLYYYNKEIIKIDDINNVLHRLYTNPRYSANSRDAMYSVVLEKYIGISRSKVQQFLINQEAYQLHKPVVVHRTVKPIVATKPNNHIQIDLIDMSNGNYPTYNNGTKRILTMIDLFSKFAWAYPLKNGTMFTVIKALKQHFNEYPVPKIIQSDNGPEFQKDLTDYLNSIGIKHIKSLPYHPTSQGAVERFNQTFKRRLFHWMTIYKTKEYLDIIPLILEGYNNTPHSITKLRPLDVYLTEDKRTINYVYHNISSMANKILDKTKRYKLPDIKKGDKVRISNYTNPDIRRRKDTEKRYLPNWSKQIYTVEYISDNGRLQLRNKDNKSVKHLYYLYEVQPVNINSLVVNNEQRPPHYQGGKLYRDIVEENVEKRKRGELLVPRKIPEYTQAQERKSRKDTVSKRQVGNLSANIKKFIGKRINMYWPNYGKWYKGEVIGYSIGRSMWIVKYDKAPDGKDREIFEDLRKERFTILE